MAITVQALQDDGTWAVRNAFKTENAKVISGAMKAAELEADARRVMGQWSSAMPDGRQLRVHNSDKDPKAEPKPRTAANSKTYGAWKITGAEFQSALSLSEGDDPLADAAYQLVRYCRGEIFHRDQAAEAARFIRGEAVAA